MKMLLLDPLVTRATDAGISITPLTRVRGVGRGDVAGLVEVITLRVDGALGAAVRVDAVEGGGAVRVGADLLAVGVVAALGPGLHLVTHHVGAVNVTRPVTRRPVRVLVAHVEHQSPPALTLGVGVHFYLTVGALKQTSLQVGSTLPESAAV